MNAKPVHRDPDRTREALLNAAFWEIWRRGFQATSLDDILKNTGVTKGALYHHFPNKMALGYAVIDEVIMSHFRTRWYSPLQATDKPIDTLSYLIRHSLDGLPEEVLQLGCPLNNIAQEMSPVDEGFRKRIKKIFDLWHAAMADALRAGQRNGTVDESVDADKAASFVLAAFEGASSLAANAQSLEMFDSLREGIVNYLDTLRPQRKAPETQTA